MRDKKELIEELKKELPEQKVIVHSGPKKQLKIVMTVLLSLCLIFGIGMLSTIRLKTGYAIFAYNYNNWPAAVLILIPLILGIYWSRKRHSVKQKL